MNTSDLIAKRFGVRTSTRENPLVDSVGTTAIPIAHNNPNRLALTIINMSANTLYVGFRPNTSSTRGIILLPNGGTHTMNVNDDFETVTWEMYAVASAASSSIYVIETVIDRGVTE